MKFNILTFLVFLVSFSVKAQRDIIVTQAGKEIRCKIVEESSMRFTYAYITDKGKVTKTEIFKTLISSYKYNYYPEDILPNEKLFKTTIVNVKPEITEAKPPKPETVRKEAVEHPKESEEKKVAQNSEKTNSKKEVDRQSKSRKKDKRKDQTVVVENETTDRTKKEIDSDSRKSNKKPDEEIAETKKDTLKIKDTVAEITDRAGDKKDTLTLVSEEKGKEKSEFTNYLKYRFGLKGGLANVMEENTDKSPYGLFKEKLLRGWVHGLDAAVFLNDNLGIGITYLNFQSRNQGNKIDIPFNAEGSRTVDVLESRMSNKFVGPTLLYRVSLDYKTFIVATASPGYYFYSEKGTQEVLGFESQHHYKGGNFGGAATLGIDFLIGDDKFGRDVILSFECGYNHGKLTKLNYGGTRGLETLSTPINLRRLDFSVGLRFNRFPRYLK